MKWSYLTCLHSTCMTWGYLNNNRLDERKPFRARISCCALTNIASYKSSHHYLTCLDSSLTYINLVFYNVMQVLACCSRQSSYIPRECLFLSFELVWIPYYPSTGLQHIPAWPLGLWMVKQLVCKQSPRQNDKCVLSPEQYPHGHPWNGWWDLASKQREPNYTDEMKVTHQLIPLQGNYSELSSVDSVEKF